MAQRKKDKKSSKKSDSKKASKSGKKLLDEAETAKTTKPREVLRRGGAPVVGILTDTPADLPVVLRARDTLESLGIPCDVRVLSALRTPTETIAYVSRARDRGLEVLIACARMAAPLAGVVAAHTTLPVIGVPIASGAMAGVDALLAAVQMPPGVPVATVGIDGTRNAAFLAARILAATHPELVERLETDLESRKSRYDSPNMDIPGQAGSRKK